MCAPMFIILLSSRAQQYKISSPARFIIRAPCESSWSNHFAGIKSGRPILRRIFRRCTKQRDSIAGFGLYRIDVDRCSIKLAELQCRTMGKEYIGVHYTSRKDIVIKENGRERNGLNVTLNKKRARMRSEISSDSHFSHISLRVLHAESKEAMRLPLVRVRFPLSWMAAARTASRFYFRRRQWRLVYFANN